MFGSDEQYFRLPFMRATVLGCAGSGKTSLVNAWVNNFCPNSYIPTDKTELYYRVVRLHCSDDAIAERIADNIEKSIVSVFAEIEDTKGVNVKGEERGNLQFDIDSLKELDQTVQGQDQTDQDQTVQGHVSQRLRQRGLAPFATLTAPTALNANDAPKGRWIYDESTDDPKLRWQKEPGERTKHTALTSQRMAFIIVYDINDPDSFEGADQIYRGLRGKQNLALKASDDDPHRIWLVANKIDKDPSAADRRTQLLKGKQLADRYGVNFIDVSAMEFVRVRKLFTEVFESVLVENDGILWAPGEFGDGRADKNEQRAFPAVGNIGGWFGGIFG